MPVINTAIFHNEAGIGMNDASILMHCFDIMNGPALKLISAGFYFLSLMVR